MNLTFERKVDNEAWEDIELTVEAGQIELRCTDTGYVQLTHEEFDEIVYLVKQYREAAKAVNLELK